MDSSSILDRLRELRAHDAPTSGGNVLAYVYDSGLPELDELAEEAARLARPLNGLDPTVFPSVAAMERDILTFTKRMLHGGRAVVGSVTSGGTESCLLAVKTARDLWRAEHPDSAVLRPRLVAPTTVHAAFRKACELFDLAFDPVPCAPDGTVAAQDLIARFADDVALIVVSAPSYPSGALDPIAAVAAAAAQAGISCHVDACFGGFVLPWWQGLQPWDFRVRGVTSISADLHKFGYAPKGVSVLLHNSRERHRKQYFATTQWPGYPVVNATLLGSKSAASLAAAWAIIEYLGTAGYAKLTAQIERAAREIREAVEHIPGLAVLGSPVGPAIALVADTHVPASERVDPHHLSDAIASLGFKIQPQPACLQSDGVKIPRTTHLTLTPVLEARVPEFLKALETAADQVRGKKPATASAAVTAMRLLGYDTSRVPSPRIAHLMLRAAGAGKVKPNQPMAGLMALIEALPAAVAETLLKEVLARMSEPT